MVLHRRAYAYPITASTATASSAQPDMGPEKTIDGSGLDGRPARHRRDHDVAEQGKVLPNWIQYQFDKVYKLWDLKVWNSNQTIESFLGFGAKDVKVEYSTDGTTWTALANVPQFARAPGTAGLRRQHHRQLRRRHGPVRQADDQQLPGAAWHRDRPERSAVLLRPVQARPRSRPPAATGVSVSTTLNWRPGREATSHKVFFGTDPNAVANGTATAKTVTDHAFDPGGPPLRHDLLLESR